MQMGICLSKSSWNTKTSHQNMVEWTFPKTARILVIKSSNPFLSLNNSSNHKTLWCYWNTILLPITILSHDNFFFCHKYFPMITFQHKLFLSSANLHNHLISPNIVPNFTRWIFLFEESPPQKISLWILSSLLHGFITPNTTFQLGFFTQFSIHCQQKPNHNIRKLSNSTIIHCYFKVLHT